MLRNLMSFCLSRRPLALVAFAAFIAVGIGAFTVLNVEAYPDPAPPIIEIIAQYPGQSPEEVERYVTIPLEIAVASTPGLTYIRSNTVFALGFIPVVGTIAALVLGFWFAARGAAYDCYDAVLARRGMPYRDKLAYLERHRARSLGLGAVVAALLLVPGINLVVLGLGAAGATVAAHDARNA